MAAREDSIQIELFNPDDVSIHCKNFSRTLITFSLASKLFQYRISAPREGPGATTRCWLMFYRLLILVLKFIGPYLEKVKLDDSIRLLYKGIVRVLLVLLHDFPEFLCDYHFNLCDLIPATAVQIQNLILSVRTHSVYCKEFVLV